jgi:hypothetical protein
MSITYEEALETLQAMFQEPWTRDTLDSVLRHQRGHMENTVDLILRHGSKDPQILINQLDSGIDPNQSLLELDEQLARQLSAPTTNTSISSRLLQQQTSSSSAPTSSSSPSTTSNLIGTVTVLPDDFLRVPNFRGSISNNTLSDDEALARMLQDELFTEELRRNPDFAHLAGRRNNSATSRMSAVPTRSASHQQQEGVPFQNPFAGLATRFQQQLQLHTASSTAQNQTQQQRDATAAANNNNIMEKLSEMGDGAKRRLQLMAAQFQQAQANMRNNNSNDTNDMSFASAPSNSERRSLLFDDTDDMELAARKDL